jgi:hypothetical protein
MTDFEERIMIGLAKRAYQLAVAASAYSSLDDEVKSVCGAIADIFPGCYELWTRERSA